MKLVSLLKYIKFSLEEKLILHLWKCFTLHNFPWISIRIFLLNFLYPSLCLDDKIIIVCFMFYVAMLERREIPNWVKKSHSITPNNEKLNNFFIFSIAKFIVKSKVSGKRRKRERTLKNALACKFFQSQMNINSRFYCSPENYWRNSSLVNMWAHARKAKGENI